MISGLGWWWSLRFSSRLYFGGPFNRSAVCMYVHVLVRGCLFMLGYHLLVHFASAQTSPSSVTISVCITAAVRECVKCRQTSLSVPAYVHLSVCACQCTENFPGSLSSGKSGLGRFLFLLTHPHCWIPHWVRYARTQTHSDTSKRSFVFWCSFTFTSVPKHSFYLSLHFVITNTDRHTNKKHYLISWELWKPISSSKINYSLSKSAIDFSVRLAKLNKQRVHKIRHRCRWMTSSDKMKGRLLHCCFIDKWFRRTFTRKGTRKSM